MQAASGPGKRFRNVIPVTIWFQEARSINIKLNWVN